MPVRRRFRGSRPSRPSPTLLLGVILAIPLGSTPVGEGSLALPARPDGVVENLSAVAVTISPATWWMIGGTTVSLSAAWTELPPGCAVSPDWFRWSVPPGVAEGILTSTGGPSTNFSAAENESGTTDVLVRAAATLSCAGGATTVLRTGEANVTVDAPVAVGNLSIEPNPARPGAPIFLNGTIVGGEAPYALSIAWGNGNVSRTIEAAAGNFAVPHELGPGTFTPKLFVVDRAGLAANGSVHEPLTVGDGFAVAIDPSSWTAEVGTATDFELRVTNPPPEFSTAETCESVAPGTRPGTVASSGLSCRFGLAGPALVTVVAVDAEFPFTVVSATLSEPVAPPLSISLPSDPATEEVGVGAYLPVSVSGGVPPFELRWNLVGDGGTRATLVDCDGRVLLPVLSASAGSDVLTVEASDALGAVAANASRAVNVSAPLQASVALSNDSGGEGVGVELSGSILSGAPPFLWAVAPTRAPANGSTTAGGLPAPGSFAWNGTFRSEGNLSITVSVVDQLGSVWWTTGLVALPAALSVNASFDPGGSGGLAVVGAIAGGVAPFELWVNGSGAPLWNGSIPADGTFLVNVSDGNVGEFPVSLTVVDQWGAHESVGGSVRLPERSPLSDPSSSTPTEIGLLLGALTAGVAVVVWRRRRTTDDEGRDGPDPISTLRAIIEPADGADRATVELLAEEQGVPFETVRAAIDRLVDDGTIRSERGSDGEEVLAWSRGR